MVGLVVSREFIMAYLIAVLLTTALVIMNTVHWNVFMIQRQSDKPLHVSTFVQVVQHGTLGCCTLAYVVWVLLAARFHDVRPRRLSATRIVVPIAFHFIIAVMYTATVLTVIWFMTMIDELNVIKSRDLADTAIQHRLIPLAYSVGGVVLLAAARQTYLSAIPPKRLHKP